MTIGPISSANATRADADLAAEQPADRQHRDLDRGADDPDLPAGARVQPGHQAVARAGPEARADVQAGRDGEQERARRRRRGPG